MPRLFIALTLPGAVNAHLAALRAPVAGVRWARPEQTHLTLRFIGDVEAGFVATLRDTLATIYAPEFELRLEGLGCFPSLRQPRILWAGVGPNPALIGLHEAVAATLASCGVPRESKSFTPHVTLARLQGCRVRELGHWLDAHRDFHTEPFPVHEFVLYSSQLRPGGAIHARVASFALSRSTGQ